MARLIFFGTKDFSAISLQALIDAEYEIAAIVTKPDSKKGRGQKITQPQVKKIALANNIPVWQPDKLADIHDSIASLQPVTGVLVSYGKIIPQPIIELFSPGIINLHPSLLPLYRGPSPIESAIINGDTVTGVSIMQISSKMDAGPVYLREKYRLKGNETQPELYQRLGSLGSKLLVGSLQDIIDEKLTPTAQDHSAASYCQLLSKTDSILRPDLYSAAQLERKVRAHLSYPRSKVSIGDNDVVVASASVSSTQQTPIDLKCTDGKFLVINELIAPSGKKMNAEAFIHGYLTNR
jgi:methionyl-tRNA formyltransferase